MYTLLHQHNLGAPRHLPDGPLMGASLLTALDRAMPFRGHAIKYVLRGTERYTVNGQPFVIRSGHYLVANPHSTGRISIDSPTEVAGLCADLPAALVDGMICACTLPDELDRTSLHGFFNSAEFLENSHADGDTRVGALMRALAGDVHADPFGPHTIDSSTYLRLAEAYVLDHRHLAPMLKRVKAARTSTRKHILRGLERAKALIHDGFSGPLDTEQMASEAGMSVFHFFRAFRSVHGITPHQYRNNLRMTKAANMLVSGDLPASEIGALCGFADKAAFSKAFRKRYGVPPSAIHRKRAGFDNLAVDGRACFVA